MAPPLRPPPCMINTVAGGRGSPHQLEVTVISAQDLYPAAQSMQTYAVAYLHTNNRVRTHVCANGHTEPSWNEKFNFRVEDTTLHSDTFALTIEVYATRTALFRATDTHLGTARALFSTLRPSTTTSYAALQIRRPTSLRPHGILNISITLVDPSHGPAPVDANMHGPSPLRGEHASKPKRHGGGADQAEGREMSEVEKKLEKWRTEIPTVSGEMVIRDDKVVRGRMGGGRPPAVAPAAEDRTSVPLQKRRSFGRSCFGSEDMESCEYTPSPPPPPPPPPPAP